MKGCRQLVLILLKYFPVVFYNVVSTFQVTFSVLFNKSCNTVFPLLYAMIVRAKRPSAVSKPTGAGAMTQGYEFAATKFETSSKDEGALRKNDWRFS